MVQILWVLVAAVALGSVPGAFVAYVGGVPLVSFCSSNCVKCVKLTSDRMYRDQTERRDLYSNQP